MKTQPDPALLKRWLPLAALALIASGMAVAISPSPPVSASSPAESYLFTTVDAPDGTKTFAMGNNANDDIVGYYVDASVPFRGFVLRGGKFSSLDFPGDNVAWTQANAINDAGDITGTYSLKAPAPVGNVHGFLLTSDGTWSTVDYPEEGHIMSGGGYAITNDRTVLGCFHDGIPIAVMSGYSLGPTGAASFKYPAADTAFAMHYGATPDGRMVVGSYRAGGTSMENWHGYLQAGDQTISFDVPGHVSANALGIRQSPDISIVGTYKVLVDKTWNQHGYVAATNGSLDPVKWDFSMVDVPGAAQTIVRGINPNGSLVGTYVDAVGTSHGFVGTPASLGSNPQTPAPPNTGTGQVGDGTLLPTPAIAGLVLAILGLSAYAAARSRRAPRTS